MFVSVTGGIQPNRLAAILNDAEIDSGMAARFLFAMPPARASRWNSDVISDEANAEYATMFERLYTLPMTLNAEGRAAPRTLPLSDDATRLFIDWYNGVGDELDALALDEGGYPLALSKLRSVPLRLALILQAASHVTEERQAAFTHIDATSMKRAIALGQWFRGEQNRVYSRLLMVRDQRRLAGIVELIHEMGGSTTVREWQRKRNIRTKEIARAELNLVAEAKLGRWQFVTPKTGGHSAETLFLNDTRPVFDPENGASVCHTNTEFKKGFSPSPKSRIDFSLTLQRMTDARPSGAIKNAASVIRRAA